MRRFAGLSADIVRLLDAQGIDKPHQVGASAGGIVKLVSDTPETDAPAEPPEPPMLI